MKKPLALVGSLRDWPLSARLLEWQPIPDALAAVPFCLTSEQFGERAGDAVLSTPEKTPREWKPHLQRAMDFQLLIGECVNERFGEHLRRGGDDDDVTLSTVFHVNLDHAALAARLKPRFEVAFAADVVAQSRWSPAQERLLDQWVAAGGKQPFPEALTDPEPGIDRFALLRDRLAHERALLAYAPPWPSTSLWVMIELARDVRGFARNVVEAAGPARLAQLLAALLLLEPPFHTLDKVLALCKDPELIPPQHLASLVNETADCAFDTIERISDVAESRYRRQPHPALGLALGISDTPVKKVVRIRAS